MARLNRYTGPNEPSSSEGAESPFYWTEGGPFTDDADYATGWSKWAGIFTDVLEN